MSEPNVFSFPPFAASPLDVVRAAAVKGVGHRDMGARSRHPLLGLAVVRERQVADFKVAQKMMAAVLGHRPAPMTVLRLACALKQGVSLSGAVEAAVILVGEIGHHQVVARPPRQDDKSVQDGVAPDVFNALSLCGFDQQADGPLGRQQAFAQGIAVLKGHEILSYGCAPGEKGESPGESTPAAPATDPSTPEAQA